MRGAENRSRRGMKASVVRGYGPIRSDIAGISWACERAPHAAKFRLGEVSSCRPTPSVPESVRVTSGTPKTRERVATLDTRGADSKARFLVDGRVVWETARRHVSFLFDAIHHRGRFELPATDGAKCIDYMVPRRRSGKCVPGAVARFCCRSMFSAVTRTESSGKQALALRSVHDMFIVARRTGGGEVAAKRGLIASDDRRLARRRPAKRLIRAARTVEQQALGRASISPPILPSKDA